VQLAVSFHVGRLELSVVEVDLDRAVTDAVSIAQDGFAPTILVEKVHLSVAFAVS